MRNRQESGSETRAPREDGFYGSQQPARKRKPSVRRFLRVLVPAIKDAESMADETPRPSEQGPPTPTPRASAAALAPHRAGGAVARRAGRAALSQRIHTAVEEPDPALSNILITQAHHTLAVELRHWVGADAGANFHAWAVWGSKKAGQTIRRKDILGLDALGYALRLAFPKRGPGGVIDNLLTLSSRQICLGNKLVLEDIGRQTARFLDELGDLMQPAQAELERFLRGLEPGPPCAGGQDLLRSAFTSYYRAKFEHDPERKHQTMLLGNLEALLHEHYKLQPHIEAAMPGPAREWLTSAFMAFWAGGEELDVSRDVPKFRGRVFPPTLSTIRVQGLASFLRTWDAAAGGLAGSGATDWSQLPQRLAYVVPLFRSRHLNEALFCAPFKPEAAAERRGKIDDWASWLGRVRRLAARHATPPRSAAGLFSATKATAGG